MLAAHGTTLTSRSTDGSRAEPSAYLHDPREVGNVGGIAFIAMEYVNGRSLRDELDAGTMSLHDARRYSVEATDALAHAHEHGVIHRDFKAGNAIIAAGRSRAWPLGNKSLRPSA